MAVIGWVARRVLRPASIEKFRQARRWLMSLRPRLRWSAFAFRKGTLGIGTFEAHRIAYRMGSVDLAVLSQSFAGDIFLSAMPDYTVPADATILDVGAHIGTFSLLAAANAPQGRVYAVEASRETFDLLATNVGLNGAPNITIDHLALADRDGVIELHHDPDGNYGHSTTKALMGSSEWVACSTLERYLETRGIRSVQLAKFNCEGAEFPILLSSPGRVLDRIDRMIVLYHCDLVEDTPDSLLNHLHTHGFATDTINQTRDRGWIIATKPRPGAPTQGTNSNE